MDDDKKATDKPEAPPAAGPHAKAELTSPDATPGTGALPTIGGASDEDMQPTG